MIKPSWLHRTLLATTALAIPGFAQAQDLGTTTPPQPTEQTGAPADASSPSNDPLEEAGPDISVPGGDIVVTGRITRDPVRSADQVISVLSTEDIARTGEGDIAGALGRVTGLSVVGDGFVYVRGLGDRYSLALLNGLPLPSPEPLRRVVPLDIFPTSIVASSLVQKSYSANYPGEFGGGVINLTTVAVPDESFLSVGMGLSGDTETTGHFGYSYYGSDTDWSGFDNGARGLPPQLDSFLNGRQRIGELSEDAEDALIGELLRPDFALTQKLDVLPVNFSGSATGGTSFDVGEARIGVVATASYDNSWQTRDIVQQTASVADLSAVSDDFRTVNTQNHILVNALLGLGAEVGEHSFRLSNLFIRDTIKETRMSEGISIDTGYSSIIQSTGWYERQLFDSQFVGELRFGDFGVDLRGGYANTQRESPFETTLDYVRTNNANDPYGDVFINRLDGQRGGATVAMSDLNEDLWYGGIDASVLLTPRLTATAGYAYTDTARTSSRREFAIRAPSSQTTYPIPFSMLRPDYLVQPAILEYVRMNGGSGFEVIENTESDPAFEASLQIHGAYGKMNWEPIDTISLDIGVRYESADQIVAPVQVFDTPSSSLAGTELSNDYWLPAATLTWEATDDLQIRLNASKTIARPQFRELIFQLYFDPESNRFYRGNPDLVDSELFNAEARAEYYLSNEERVSIAGFYKKIDNPIETFVSFLSNSTRAGFANAPEARLMGAEAELTRYFDLDEWGGLFDSRRLFVIANYTFTDSELLIDEGDMVTVYPSGPRPASNYFLDGAPLTGQSDHVANLQFGFEDRDSLSQQTILISYASERVVGRGDLTLPDIIEDPGIRVDFVARQGVPLFGIDTEWKFEVRNIFGENYEEFQANDENRIDLNTYDIGRKIALSVTANF